MKKLLLLPLLLASFGSACTSDLVDQNPDMTLQSEDCRAQAAFGAARMGVGARDATADKQDVFRRTYRNCMADKGYAVGLEAQ